MPTKTLRYHSVQGRTALLRVLMPCLGLMFMMFGSARACDVNALGDLLRSQKQVAFQTVNAQRYDAARSLFSRLFGSRVNTENKQPLEQALLPTELLDNAGLSATWLSVAGAQAEILLLQETEQKAQGQGAFLFSFAAGNQWVIQAPHQFYDQLTGQLALQFFHEQPVRALAINTVHRYQTEQSDLAHQPASLFAAFAEAYSLQVADGYLLQLHGFSANKRATSAGKEADVILSNGSVFPSTKLQHSAACLNKQSPLKTYVYGKDIDELGGTQNSSLQIMRQTRPPFQTGPMFIHMELSKDARKKLVGEQSLRHIVWSCWQE